MTQPKWMPENPFPKMLNCMGETSDEEESPSYHIYEGACHQTALKLVEWLEQLCITPNHIQCGLRRGCCPECIEELKKEVQGG